MIINERIKEVRNMRDLTLLQVAEQLGVKEATMQRYESGSIKNIKYETIIKLAEIFDCSPVYLMGWSNDLGTFQATYSIQPTNHASSTAFIALNNHEHKVISSYRKQSEIQLAIDLLLEDQECCQLVNKYARLDHSDKIRVSERIDVMLEDEKYTSTKKALRNA